MDKPQIKQIKQKKQENKIKSEENIIYDTSKISTEDKNMTKNNLLETVRNGQFQIDLTEEEKAEPYFESQYHRKECPEKICDGSGYSYQTVNGKMVSFPCVCVQKEIMIRKLKNANFNADYFDATMDSFEILDSLLQLNYYDPHEKPMDRITAMDELFHTTKGKKSTAKGNKAYEPTDLEEANLYVHMNYKVRKQSSISRFMKHYANTILNRLNNGEQTLHLLMFGDSGKAKTHMACAIGRHFLENNKTVSYIKLKDLMEELKKDQFHEETNSVIANLEKKDLFIFDELGGEYHKENGWALLQIQNLFKSRNDSNKPTIIITNYYPHELHETYEDKIMSMFNGKFIMVQPVGSIDLRPYFRKNLINQFDFIE